MVYTPINQTPEYRLRAELDALLKEYEDMSWRRVQYEVDECEAEWTHTDQVILLAHGEKIRQIKAVLRD